MFWLFSFLCWVCLSQEQTEVIQINDGKIQGTIIAGVREFRTIPYAAPPVDSLRWAPPEQPQPWSDVLQTNINPPGCPQNCDLAPHGCPVIQDEDCLYLNVFTPQTATNSSMLPVLVFFHGGNYDMGYSGGPLYNGTANIIHNRDVILVSVNYRLGALGFLWSTVGPDGNYGMLDQILSLEWVRSNIAYFGGDPDKVTIYGQSAGAMSVALHMMHQYENSNPLFRAAILESEPFALPFRDIKTWGPVPQLFFNAIGCNDSRFDRDNAAFWDCLRAVDIETIKKAQYEVGQNPIYDAPHFWNVFIPWTPTMGTDLFPEQPLWAFQKGNYVDVPYIIGVVANESVPFVYGAIPVPIGTVETELLCDMLIGPNYCQDVYKKYPFPSNRTDLRPWASVVVTDGLFRCPTHNTSAAHTEMYNSGEKTNTHWFYHFNHVSSFNEPFWGANQTYCDDVVCHAAELPYVFHPNPSVDHTTYAEEEQYLSYNMMSYWTYFATNLKPGSGSTEVPANASGVAWNDFDTSQSMENVIVFQTGSPLEMVNNYDTDICVFWDEMGYPWVV